MSPFKPGFLLTDRLLWSFLVATNGPASGRPFVALAGIEASAGGVGARLARSARAGFLRCMSPEVRFLYITVPDREVGLGLARHLVGEGLAACGNLMGPVTSVYEWEGQLEQNDELVLLLKTRRELIERVMARVVELHPYECPCVVELPVGAVHPPFAEWVAERTASGTAGCPT